MIERRNQPSTAFYGRQPGKERWVVLADVMPGPAGGEAQQAAVWNSGIDFFARTPLAQTPQLYHVDQHAPTY